MRAEISGLIDVNYAAGHLPEGWQLCIEIEKGSMDVCLYDPYGNKNCDFCDDDMPPYQMVQQRVDRAVGIVQQEAKDLEPKTPEAEL